jgi:hypothetical protein
MHKMRVQNDRTAKRRERRARQKMYQLPQVDGVQQQMHELRCNVYAISTLRQFDIRSCGYKKTT